jgi:hypothetical protein
MRHRQLWVCAAAGLALLGGATAGAVPALAGTASTSAPTGVTASQGSQAVAAVTKRGKGCPVNGVRMEKGDIGRIGDVDGDGRADRQFYSLESAAYGIRTASGATIVLHDNLPATNQHGGWTAKVGTSFITVIDDGQTAEVFRFANCRFVPVTTRYGLPFLSVLSGGGYGSRDSDLVRYGLTCTGVGAKRSLANVIAAKEDNGSWRLSTYRLRKAGANSLTQENDPSTAEQGLKASTRRVQDASLSRCGTDPKVFSDGK